MDAIAVGNVAVVTGAAGGIGLAIAERLAGAGMRVVLADSSASVMQAAQSLGDRAAGFVVDVADRAAVERFACEVADRFGPVSFLMNNAAIHGGADALTGAGIWDRTLAVNLMGVLHGVQAFVPAMVAHGRPAVVVNTGSKQGITQPPGNTAYNVSKSGVKALTEGLAHTLREETGGRVTAHLLIPGSTFTGMTGAKGRPAGSWLPGQVADFLLAGLGDGDFYVLCPDDETTRPMDEKRMAWAMGDVIHNRPALSRWHPAFRDRFAAFLSGEGPND
ncbi:SDR family NAD(P)-dependent oxidoreductase [Roseomonas sp. WA12]